MEKHNFKKKYGQNFLRNDAILNRIVSSFECDKQAKIIEVGPGDGALTKLLVKKEVPVFSFEIDESLKQYLDKIDNSNLNVIYGDFLEVKLNEYFNEDDNLYVIANIPYYITTPIITKFIELEKTYPYLKEDFKFKEIKEYALLNEGRIVYSMEGYDKGVLNYNNYQKNRLVNFLSKILKFPKYDYYNK